MGLAKRVDELRIRASVRKEEEVLHTRSENTAAAFARQASGMERHRERMIALEELHGMRVVVPDDFFFDREDIYG